MSPVPCVFCQIIDGRAPGEILQVWPDALAIRPLRPVTAGHVLVIPRVHVTDATTDPVITAVAARRAAQIARPGWHLGANVGPEAGQTVPHLHLHAWPCLGDRCMPWGCPGWSAPASKPKPRVSLEEARELAARAAEMHRVPDRAEDPDA